MEGNVQSKIKCVFNTSVINCTSSKHKGQNFNVVATDTLQSDALQVSLKNAFATEKVDGTCCFIYEFKGKLCLWARLDRKLNKKSSKRFKDFRYRIEQWKKNDMKTVKPEFSFNYLEDLKTVPEAWIPAFNVDRHPKDKHIVPDANGHIPGWVPISCDPKQYCWHHSVVFDQQQLLLVLKETEMVKDEIEKRLQLAVEPMSKYSGRTLELIGTNINANPYGLGTKKYPFHVLIPHGCLSSSNLPCEFELQKLNNWFINKESSTFAGNVEGIVWHCEEGIMFKLHRHHLNLPWPILKEKSDEAPTNSASVPLLCQREVQVESETLQDIKELPKLFEYIKELHLKSFSSLILLSDCLRRYME